MSGYLLDTNVVSMLAPPRADAPAGFAGWLERADGEGRVFLCVVTIHEIERGVARLDRRGAVAKARPLRGWLAGLVAAYADKILPLDIAAASLSGRLEAAALGGGYDPRMADAIVAGIAAARHLQVITRNTKPFIGFGVKVATPEEICGRS